MRTVTSNALLRQLTKFGLVGGVGFVVDVSIFTVLRLTVLAPERIHEGPIIAKVISTIVAIGVNWVGNRYWTFGPHRSARTEREAFEFVVVSLLGMAVALGCLWVSRYMLGFTSVLADNISSNVIGLILGSALRFALYRHWVYKPGRRSAKSAQTAPAEPEPVAATH